MEQEFLKYLEQDIEENYQVNDGVEWVNYILNNSLVEERVDYLLSAFNEEKDTELTISDIENNTDTFDLYTYYLDRLTLYTD